MGIINVLRFDEHSGGMITDEESWEFRRRRTFLNVNFHHLLAPEVSEELNIEAVYGGLGMSTFHQEVIDKTQKKLASMYANWKKQGGKTPPFTTLKDVAQVTLEVFQAVIRRKADERVKFLYGFHIEDLNKGSFKVNNDSYEIKQESVRTKALNIATGKDALIKSVSDSQTTLFGYDPEHGFTGYCIKGTDCVLSFVGGGFEAIGTGKYGSAISLASFLNKKFLGERKKGYNRVEATVELVKSGLIAGEFFREVGGYFHYIYINGKKAPRSEKVVEVTHHSAKVLSEIVLAYMHNYLTRQAAFELVDKLVFSGANYEAVEKLMFARSRDLKSMDLLLRGYKVNPHRNEALKDTQLTRSIKKGY